MGRVVVGAKIENIVELYNAEQGMMPSENVHRLEESDALVDTGSTFLAMPKTKILQLGFTKPTGRVRSRTTRGPVESDLYGPVKLTVQGRHCTVDIAEIEEGNPVLIGQVPLELMDFVVDPKSQRLIGNPEHGGQWMIDMF